MPSPTPTPGPSSTTSPSLGVVIAAATSAVVAGAFAGLAVMVRSERKERVELEARFEKFKYNITKDRIRRSNGSQLSTVSRINNTTTFIMISGDSSQVGKSSICLGVLGGILKNNYAKPEEIGYVKPATQCEKPTMVSKFCRTHGIESIPIGPIVFFSGFTRSFLRGEQRTTEEMLNEVFDAVKKLARGKKFVLVDGVGFPSVGSICGVSNANIASKLGIPVLLVGKKGVGEAVDSTNRNIAYFEKYGVTVLGSIFNKLPVDREYYNKAKCQEYVGYYFKQYNPSHKLYGFIPEIEALKGANKPPTAPSSEERAPDENKQRKLKASDDVKMTEEESKRANTFINAFCKNVNLSVLLKDASSPRSELPILQPNVHSKSVEGLAKSGLRVSRDSIESAAKGKGAKGG